jgi:hypothetical protein
VVGAVFPTAGEAQCWKHRLVNVLDTLQKELQAEARELLTTIPYAETRAEVERQKRAFQTWATKRASPLQAPYKTSFAEQITLCLEPDGCCPARE